MDWGWDMTKQYSDILYTLFLNSPLTFCPIYSLPFTLYNLRIVISIKYIEIKIYFKFMLNLKKNLLGLYFSSEMDRIIRDSPKFFQRDNIVQAFSSCREPGSLDSNPGSASYKLRDLGQVI